MKITLKDLENEIETYVKENNIEPRHAIVHKTDLEILKSESNTECIDNTCLFTTAYGPIYITGCPMTKNIILLE